MYYIYIAVACEQFVQKYGHLKVWWRDYKRYLAQIRIKMIQIMSGTFTFPFYYFNYYRTETLLDVFGNESLTVVIFPFFSDGRCKVRLGFLTHTGSTNIRYLVTVP